MAFLVLRIKIVFHFFYPLFLVIYGQLRIQECADTCVPLSCHCKEAQGNSPSSRGAFWPLWVIYWVRCMGVWDCFVSPKKGFLAMTWEGNRSLHREEVQSNFSSSRGAGRPHGDPARTRTSQACHCEEAHMRRRSNLPRRRRRGPEKIALDSIESSQ